MKYLWGCTAAMMLTAAMCCAAPVPGTPLGYWIAPGQDGGLAAQLRFHDSVGEVAVLFAQGPVKLQDNPFVDAGGRRTARIPCSPRSMARTAPPCPRDRQVRIPYC